MLDNLEKDLLEKVAGIKDKPQGAYNIRLNSKAVDRASSKNITITMLTIIAIFLFSIILPCLYYHIFPD